MKPPNLINGLIYDTLIEPRYCLGGCARVLDGGELIVKRDSKGICFAKYIPEGRGICLICTASRLTKYNLEVYNKIITTIETLGNISTINKPSEELQRKKELLKLEIKGLTQFIDKISQFINSTTEKEEKDI